MAFSEFNLIERFFVRDNPNRSDVVLGIGDDCALLDVPKGQSLAVSMDTLVEGVHFLPDTAAGDVAAKALAVNLSDLAAIGAEPAWVTLSLSIPKVDMGWLQSFSDSFHELLNHYMLQVVGGDTTRGPLSITMQAHGFVPAKFALRRSGAQVGDMVCVTGRLGEASLGLQIAQHKLSAQGDVREQLLNRHYRPKPKVAAGIALRGRANATIDVSDGLVADLGHICKASGVGAVINAEKLPLSDAAIAVSSEDNATQAALTGGDDYELCFTVPENDLRKVEAALETVGVACYPVGRITGKQGVKVVKNGQPYEVRQSGFDHFVAA